MSALLPCPFCNAELEDRRISAFAHPKNGCILDGFAMTDPAIPKWNRRTPPPLPSREEVARVLYGRRAGGSYPFSGSWEREVQNTRNWWLADAAAVLRLLGGERNGG